MCNAARSGRHLRLRLESRRAELSLGCRPVLVEKLGEGGEAEVFALDDRRVLRRFRRADHPAIDERVALAQEVAAGAGSVDFMVPEILDVYRDDEGHPCFIERRLPGRSMTEALGDVGGRRRELLLDSYMETAQTIRSIEFSRPWFGELLRPDPLHTSSWSEFLAAALERQCSNVDPAQYPEVTDFEAEVSRLTRRRSLGTGAGAELGALRLLPRQRALRQRPHPRRHRLERAVHLGGALIRRTRTVAAVR